MEDPFHFLFHHLSTAMFGWESIVMLLYQYNYCEKRVDKIRITTKPPFLRTTYPIDVKVTILNGTTLPFRQDLDNSPM